MVHEILTPDEMGEADRRAIAAGPLDGYGLMRNAGRAVADEALARYPDARAFDILCGPGNNGGDGYVAARMLAESGCTVRVWAHAPPRDGSDAALAAGDWTGPVAPLSTYRPARGTVVFDALFGAGLARPLDAAFGTLLEALRKAALPVVAVDLPSGLPGLTGRPDGPVCPASVTVTFARKKPAHLLQPGRGLCGDVVVADIGILAKHLPAVSLRENAPDVWLPRWPVPADDTHMYRRGLVAAFSGGAMSTGAARLSAMAAARSGAGAVTVVSPPNALAVNAMHLTSIMLRRTETVDDALAFVADRKVRAAVLGPGFGDPERLRELALALLEAAEAPFDLVLDADAFTAFADAPAVLFEAAGASKARLTLTPHAGEFSRLFGDLALDNALSKVDQGRRAAARADATIILKGADTVVADRDGRAAINANGSPWLATAGSGDVLAGIVAGLAAQGMPGFDAACAAVWIHAEAGAGFGPGLIADDMPGLMPPIIARLHEARTKLPAPGR